MGHAPPGDVQAEIRVPPFWRIARDNVPSASSPGDGPRLIRMVPGAGWGTGAHETTQLCLQAITHFAPRGGAPWRMLDFGAGSGILSIGAAMLGARVDAVEIDEEGVAHGEENARLNGMGNRVGYSRRLGAELGCYDVVVANILRPVLLGFSGELAGRLTRRGVLILSGLVSTDVPELAVRFGGLIGDHQFEVFKKGEWRALVWRRGS